MKILVLSQYFWPETFVINNLVIKLASQGHEVTVATGKPNYPEGKIFAGYAARGLMVERYLDSVDVIRAPIYPRGRGGAKNLLLNYFSFVFAGLLYFPWALRGKEFDVILVFAPSPIVQVIPAILLKWIKKSHLCVWVQDLWPESLSATGFVKNIKILRLVGTMVRWIYKCCDTLLLQSHAFFKPIEKYASVGKLLYFPNSIDISSDCGRYELPAVLAEELSNCFSVVFAGNVGTAQSMESIVEAAKILRNNQRIKIFIVGSGSMFSWVADQKRFFKLGNLILPGRFPMSAMPEIFERSSVLLVSLKDEEIFSYTVPSKIQAYLAAGKPIIAAIRGEGARVVCDAGAGLVCSPESGEALADVIIKMNELSSFQRDRMGKAGLHYFNCNYDMDVQCHRLIDILTTRLAKGKIL